MYFFVKSVSIWTVLQILFFWLCTPVHLIWNETMYMMLQCRLSPLIRGCLHPYWVICGGIASLFMFLCIVSHFCDQMYFFFFQCTGIQSNTHAQSLLSKSTVLSFNKSLWQFSWSTFHISLHTSCCRTRKESTNPLRSWGLSVSFRPSTSLLISPMFWSYFFKIWVRFTSHQPQHQRSQGNMM